MLLSILFIFKLVAQTNIFKHWWLKEYKEIHNIFAVELNLASTVYTMVV